MHGFLLCSYLITPNICEDNHSDTTLIEDGDAAVAGIFFFFITNIYSGLH